MATPSWRPAIASCCRSSRSTASGRSSTSCRLMHYGAGLHKRTPDKGLCDTPTQERVPNCKNPCVVLQAPPQSPPADRLTVGVAARLSRYLQVLTQAKKMGKVRISSQEISDYTNINATQIR